MVEIRYGEGRGQEGKRGEEAIRSNRYAVKASDTATLDCTLVSSLFIKCCFVNKLLRKTTCLVLFTKLVKNRNISPF